MRCIICEQADVEQRVLARVCPNCGEEYVDETTAVHLMAAAEQAVRSGIQVEVCDYASAV